MQLSPQQKQAFDNIMKWYKSPKPFYVLAGYAGTGKSTIANIIANEIGQDKTVFCAYTGKAAKVLKNKGCGLTGTIHSFLYQFISENKDSQPVFKYAPTSDIKNCNLIIVDEYSMLGEPIFIDLINTNKKILFLGDPFQLPPVGDKNVKLEPDYFLEEIHRQSQESPILKAATMVRTGQNLIHCDWGDFKYCPRASIGFDDYAAAEQVIVGRNATRDNFNNKLREKLGYSGGLKLGEKIICRQNQKAYGLLNGMIGYCTKITPEGFINFTTEGDEFYNLRYWRGAFDGSGSKYTYNKELQKFEWAYAITCHLAQGSEFDNVIVFNEPLGDMIEQRRWLYTAITRGKNKVTLVD